MAPQTAHRSRSLLRRTVGLTLIGLVSLSLVTACSDYGTTGSGGTNGAGPTGGTGSGVGGGGSVATPSGGVNTTSAANSPTAEVRSTAVSPPASEGSRTSGAPPIGTVTVPTPYTGGGTGSGIGADSGGTPPQAGTGAVSATRAAVTGAPGGDVVILTPGASPSATGAATATPR
jgi:hypothetical protein